MEQFRNTFDGGLDTNTVRSLIGPNKYTDANNINLTSIGNFFALENIQGTTSVQTITALANREVFGIYPVNFRVGETNDNAGLFIITGTNDGENSILKFWGYVTNTDTLYELYEEPIDDPSTYFSNDRTFDVIIYPENNVEILYLTDHFSGPKKFVCNIPTPYSANFLTEFDVKMFKAGAVGAISLDNITTGGSLFCGSYQFAYQLLNPETNQNTKFSLFTNPFHVWNTSTLLGALNTNSGVGVNTNKQIKLNIVPSEKELDYYTHFRLAIVENIYPQGVVVSTAQLTQIEDISEFLSGGTIEYAYKHNIRLETTDISEIVVDKAAIKHFKSLAVRENRLVGGNVVYKNLEYDNGDPVVASGSILKVESPNDINMFAVENNASNYKGYFRDEIYRFAISYFDEDGNFSEPKFLDMSNITHNQAAVLEGTSAKDMKFPARSKVLDSTSYTLFGPNGGIQTLGLRFNSVINHPSWASGFVILRAPRIKNVLFQTPVVPMMKVYGNGTVEEYPGQIKRIDGDNDIHDTDIPDSQPMGPFTTYLPRNYFQPMLNHIVKYNANSVVGSGQNRKFDGESYYTVENSYDLAMVFPQQFMYEDIEFNFSKSYRFTPVDAALLKLDYNTYDDLSVGNPSNGLNIRTSVSGTFYALQDSVYYYNSSHTGTKKQLTEPQLPIAYENIVQNSTGALVDGLPVFRYDKLTTSGVTWGNPGTAQKCGVFKLDYPRYEINAAIDVFNRLSFSAGNMVDKDFLGLAAPGDPKFYLNESNYLQTIQIVNITAGLDDQRYGKTNTPHEYISTGTITTFTEAEKADLKAGIDVSKDITVFGGDCYVSPHLFKLTDTCYGVSMQQKFVTNGVNLGPKGMSNAAKSWEIGWSDLATGTDAALSITVPYNNSAQYLQLILESEYNGLVIDNEIVDQVGQIGPNTKTRIPIYGNNFGGESGCRIPLTYKLNTNHAKINNNKIFRLKDPLSSTNNILQARFVYSDQKVYQSSITGFDTFRVLNYYDLEETYGAIHGMKVVANDLYAIQDKAITYIGIGERTLETTDALQLAVQTGSFIGNTIIIDANKGSQHLNSIINTGSALYMVDNRAKNIYRLASKELNVISEPTMASRFRSVLQDQIPEKELISIYDIYKKQILFVKRGDNSFAFLYDEPRNIWISNYKFGDSVLLGGASQSNYLYLLGAEDNNIQLSTLYTGDRTRLFGTLVEPNVTFTVNPAPEMSKTFDDILILSSDRLKDLDIVVERETALGNQIGSGISLDLITRGEGNYRTKILRDENNARFRGGFASITLNWKDSEPSDKAIITSVISKYRPSQNVF